LKGLRHLIGMQRLTAITSYFEKYRRTPNRYWARYGLLPEDLLSKEWPMVNEACARLPWRVTQERDQRKMIAHDCAMKTTVLPEYKWTPERTERYLKWFLDEVAQEERERALFRAG